MVVSFRLSCWFGGLQNPASGNRRPDPCPHPEAGLHSEAGGSSDSIPLWILGPVRRSPPFLQIPPRTPVTESTLAGLLGSLGLDRTLPPRGFAITQLSTQCWDHVCGDGLTLKLDKGVRWARLVMTHFQEACGCLRMGLWEGRGVHCRKEPGGQRDPGFPPHWASVEALVKCERRTQSLLHQAEINHPLGVCGGSKINKTALTLESLQVSQGEV